MKSERNIKILSLINSGNTFLSISKRYNISTQRVQQISKEHGIFIHKKNHKKKEEIVKLIKEDILKLTYGEIRKKYDIFEKHSWVIINKKFKEIYGENIVDIMRKNRNKIILNKYSSGYTAKETLELEEQCLKSPIRFTKERDVYRVSVNQGYKKYPDVINRAAGGSFEDEKIIKLIVKMHEKDKMSFNKISKSLNEKGFLTVTGAKFSPQNTFKKYNNYIKHLVNNPLIAS